LEFKYYSSVAGVTVSAAGAAVSVTGAAVSVATGATFLPPEPLFQLHLLCQNLYQKVLQQLQLLLKIKFYRLI
jgi:hypothetical protein